MLIEQIRADRMQAMKDHLDVKKNLLSTLIGDACKEVKEPDDASVIAMIKKFIKNSEELCKLLRNQEEFERDYQRVRMEIEILESYLPQQLSEDQIKEIIETITFEGDPNLKEIMAFFKYKFAGQYDGALVSKLAREVV